MTTGNSGVSEGQSSGITPPTTREMGTVRPFQTTISQQPVASARAALWQDIWARYMMRPLGLLPVGLVWRQPEEAALATSSQYRFTVAPQLRFTLIDGRVFQFTPGERELAAGSTDRGGSNSPPLARAYQRPLSHIESVTRLSRRLWSRQEMRRHNDAQRLAIRLANDHVRHEMLVGERPEDQGAAAILTRVFNHALPGRQVPQVQQQPAGELPQQPATLDRALRFGQEPSPLSSAQQLPPSELNRVTNHVLRQIDQRLQAYRERTGRI